MYGEPYIRAFSHIHDWQLAGVPVMPIVGRMNGHEGYEAYKAPFSHDKEVARAGYHKVVLDNSGITVGTRRRPQRVGFHRYSFPGDAGRATCCWTSARRIGDDEDGGRGPAARRTARNWPGSRRWRRRSGARSRARCIFVVDFDRDVDEFGGWEKTASGQDGARRRDRVAGADSGGFVRFRLPSPAQVQMKVAISYV